MAKFDDLYPEQSEEIDQKGIEFEGTEMIKFGQPQPCSICGTPTKWIDINFLGHFCSEECDREMWRNYWRDTYGAQSQMPDV